MSEQENTQDIKTKNVYKTSKSTWLIFGLLAIIAIVIVVMMMRKKKGEGDIAGAGMELPNA